MVDFPAAATNAGEPRRGHYLGTEVGGKWWRRYTKDGLLARGLGDYWFDDTAVFFRRYLTREPIVISYRDILGVGVGKWHSGRWAGGALVVKITWTRGDTPLVSGFVFSRDAHEAERLAQEISRRARGNRPG